MGLRNPTYKPDDGCIIIPTKLDQLAQHSPDHVFAAIPRSENLADGLEDITISTLAGAVNRVAWWLEAEIGKSKIFETIAYIGPADLRYFILAIAATKVGYKTLLPSPRNSIEGQLSLLESTNCSILFSAATTKVDDILAKRRMRHIIVGELREWLSNISVSHYPFDKSFQIAENEPFVVLHTSGSTGLPKPIVVKHGWMTTADRHKALTPLDGYVPQTRLLHDSTRLFFALPPFHAAGLDFLLAFPLYLGCTIVWPSPSQPVSVEILETVLDNVKLDIVYAAPSTWEDFSQSQTSVEKLKKVKYIGYLGGALARSTGDLIAKYVRILNTIGSTEVGTPPLFLTDPEDWMYVHHDPRLKGFEFHDIGDGLYEKVIVRHPSTDGFHSAWYTFPDKKEYWIKDLYTKHPSKPNLWLYMGRADDIIVLSNGEKLNPIDMENTLRDNPNVSDIIIVGQGRFETAALIELKGNYPQCDDERTKLFDSLHPYIIEGNKKAAGHAKLSSDRITFTAPDKPMLRTAKGTVRRAVTIKLYETEINQLYAGIEGKASSYSIKLNFGDKKSLVKSLTEMLQCITEIERIRSDQDLFTLGIDSLQVMAFGRQLKQSFTVYDLGVPADRVTPRLIYSHPTVSRLADALQKLATQKGKTIEAMEKERIRKMEDMLVKYTKDLPEQSSQGLCQEHKHTVIITGSTGSLGSYLLDSLFASPQISQIFCLNRGFDSENKQREGNASRGLVTKWGDEVKFLQADLSKPDLGLNEADYGSLLKECSFIIHNQWQVDFNLALDSFEPHVAGVRGLIDMSIKSIQRPPILFTSSIATLGNWTKKHPGEDVPEIPLHDFTIPSPMGYAESKYVSELLLEKAGELSGVRSVICRIGQVAGPVVQGGVWNKREWLPTLIASSKYLSKLPQTLAEQENIDWIPVDILSTILVELLLTNITSPSPITKYHHLVNPHAGSWTTLVPTVTECLTLSSPNKQVPEVVSFPEWVKILRESSEQEGNVARNPGVKLLEFYESMCQGGLGARLGTRETVKGSETMRGLEGVGREWMEIWLRQWGFMKRCRE